MIASNQSWTKTLKKLIHNPHFWAIIAIFIAVTLMYWFYYYSNIDLNGEWRKWFWYISVFEYRLDMQGSLFFIPLLYALFIYWWRGVLITWLLSALLLIPHIIKYAPDTMSVYTNIIFFSVPLLIVLFISAELKWRNRERKMLADRESERQVYMSQIFRAQEDERRRIAQELHDDTTQTLLVVANRAQSILSDENSPISQETKDETEWIRDTLITMSEDVRRISLDLRPSILDDVGLIPAIRWLCERLGKEDAIDAQLIVNGKTRKLTSEADVIIFRIVQEGLNNVRRHSHATRVFVNLDFIPEVIRIVIQDNGIGFSIPKTVGSLAGKGKLGLMGMQERASFLNGTINVSSEPGKGTKVTIEVRP